MYTSGTTGDPKGVLISNESIVTFIAGVKRLLESVNEEVITVLFTVGCEWGLFAFFSRMGINLCFLVLNSCIIEMSTCPIFHWHISLIGQLRSVSYFMGLR